CLVLCWGRATPMARLLMLVWTADLGVRCPEENDAPSEWRAPSTRHEPAHAGQTQADAGAQPGAAAEDRRSRHSPVRPARHCPDLADRHRPTGGRAVAELVRLLQGQARARRGGAGGALRSAISAARRATVGRSAATTAGNLCSQSRIYSRQSRLGAGVLPRDLASAAIGEARIRRAVDRYA